MNAIKTSALVYAALLVFSVLFHVVPAQALDPSENCTRRCNATQQACEKNCTTPACLTRCNTADERCRARCSDIDRCEKVFTDCRANHMAIPYCREKYESCKKNRP